MANNEQKQEVRCGADHRLLLCIKDGKLLVFCRTCKRDHALSREQVIQLLEAQAPVTYLKAS